MTGRRRIIAGQLKQGQEFCLTEDGMWPDVFETFHGFGTRWDRDDPRKSQRVLVYTCALGYRDEIPVDFPVWVETGGMK